MDAFEVTVPLDKPQKLKVLFNNSAYITVKKETGRNVFSLQGSIDILDPEIALSLLFAGTRKFHGSGTALITKESLTEWMDIIDPYDAIMIYQEVGKAFTASFLPRGKRAEYLEMVTKEVKKATQKVETLNLKIP